jgi:hypothetical protein
MPDDLKAKTVTLPGVKIVRTGTWAASTGVTTITEEDLEDMVKASVDPNVDQAPLKIGHVDPNYDGYPALGWVENLRVDDGVLIGDLVDVPAALAEVIPKAFRRRSAEIGWAVRTPEGEHYRATLMGLALLGKTPPAVKGLGDVLELYGIDAEELEPASKTATKLSVGTLSTFGVDAEGNGTTALAAVNLDSIRRAWEDAFPTEVGAPMHRWVHEVWLNPGTSGGYVIVEPGDEPDQVIRVPWSIDENDDVIFGAPEAVKVVYAPTQLAARTTILEQVAAKTMTPEAARTLLSAIATPEAAISPANNPPTSGSGVDNGNTKHSSTGKTGDQEAPGMDEKRIQELLEEEDEAKAIEAFKTLRAEPEGEPKPDDQGPDPAKPGSSAPEGGEPKPEGEAKPAAPAPTADEDDPMLVKLSAGSWEQVQTDLAAGRDAAKQLFDQKVAKTVKTALSEGRISPVPDEVKAWKERLEKDFDGTAALLSSLAQRFPVTEEGDDDASALSGDDAAWDGFMASTFPELAQQANQGGN